MFSPKKTELTKKPLDTAQLKLAIARIVDCGAIQQEVLKKSLVSEFKAKFVKTDQVFVISMLGIKSTSTGGYLMAINNWANAARRALKVA